MLADMQINHSTFIKLFLLGFSLIMALQMQAQDKPKTDSLKNLLSKAKEEDKVPLLNALGWEYRNSHFLEALKYLNDAIQRAEIARDYTHLSQAYNFKGVVYRNLNVYRQAMECFYQALKIAEKYQIVSQSAYAYNNIGDMYYQQEGYSLEAIQNIRKAIQIFKKIDDQKGLAYAYLRLGEVYQAGQKLDLALSSVKKSLQIREKLAKDNAYATSLQRIGQIYLQKGEASQALPFFKVALEIYQKEQDVRGELSVLINYASIYQQKKEYTMARKYTLQALQKANSYSVKDSKRNALRILYELAQAQGDYRLAFEYQSRFVIENDSLANQDINELVAKLNALNELEKKENQLLIYKKNQALQQETLLRQRIILFSVIIALLLAAVIVILLWRRNQQKQKNNEILQIQKNEIEAKSRELLSLYNEIKYQKEDYQALANELSTINQTKDKLFSITSHDMRSPLNTLKGLISLFNDDNISKEEMQEMSKKLEIKVNTLLEFLDNLLNWSKAQMQGIEMIPQTFHLSQVIDDNLNLLSPQAQNKQIKVYALFPEDLYSFADPNMTSLVLRNLISNAIKFTNLKGSVYINAIMLDDSPHIEVSIKDNGIGLEEARLEQIFSLESYTTPGTDQETGTGLGLLLCKEFVEKQGGKIRVESKKNEGSTFIFTIPTPKKKPTQETSGMMSLQ